MTMTVPDRLGVLAPVLEMKSDVALENLVHVLKAKQGIHGNWLGYLAFVHPQYEHVLNQPSVQTKRELIGFLMTLREPEDLETLALLLSPSQSVVYDLRKQHPGETSQQRLVRMTLRHENYCFEFLPLFDEKDWVVTGDSRRNTTGGAAAQDPDTTCMLLCEQHPTSDAMFALSTDLVLCEGEKEAAVRVVVVGQDLQVVFNRLVKPDKTIVDYRTGVTGLSAVHLQDAITLATVQAELKELFSVDTIMIGHGLSSDMKGLKLHHARVIDTSLVFKYETAPHKPCLNDLCRSVLVNEPIPNSCVQKAESTMRIVLALVNNGGANTYVPDPAEMFENPVAVDAAAPPGQQLLPMSILSCRCSYPRIHFIHRCSCNNQTVHICAFRHGDTFISAPPDARPTEIFTEWIGTCIKVRVVCVCKQVLYNYLIDTKTGYGYVKPSLRCV